MIRDWFSHRSNKGIWKSGRPVKRREKPVKLFEKGILLHIGPVVISTFDGQFSKVLNPDKIIESEHIVDIPTRFVAILWCPYKVEISKNEPIFIRWNIHVKEPIGE